MTGLRWTCVHWIAAAAGTAVVLLAVGVLTGLVATPLYARTTRAPGWSCPVLLATAAISGLLIASYARHPGAPPAPGVVATIGSLLAVACPVCHKFVVAMAAVGGALSVWPPLRPVLGTVSVVLLGWALRRRLAAQRCPASAVRESTDSAVTTSPGNRVTIRNVCRAVGASLRRKPLS